MFNRSAPRWRYLQLLVWFLQAAPIPLFAQEPPAKEVYQDFRSKRPLLPAFKLDGPDLDTAVTSEDGGLRIMLPATRAVNRPVYIATTFTISGDFEITGTYELLAADLPTKGYGVGVSLTISPDDGVRKFARVARLMRPQTGSRFVSEYSSKDPPKGYKILGRPAETRAGQLRLVREGPKLLFLVSEAPGQEFLKVDEQEKFGTEDLEFVRFHVTDGNTPGYAVDVRLVDLRVRYGNSKLGHAMAAAPLAPPEPVDAGAEVPREPPIKGWLAASFIVGLAIILCCALTIGVGHYVRKRRGGRPHKSKVEEEESEPIATPTSVALVCSDCGKNIRARPESAGKKIKCPNCGKKMTVLKTDAE